MADGLGERSDAGDMPASDDALVRRVRGGDEAAFELLVDRHGSGLLRLAMSLLGQWADAEDVVQETFAAAVEGLGGFQGRASVKTWLTRILIRRIARWRRRGRVRRVQPLADEQASPAERDQAAGLDLQMDFAAVLGRLSPEHRDVIVLRELQSLSYDEIACVLSVPRGTVESRLARARARLRELLKDYQP